MAAIRRYGLFPTASVNLPWRPSSGKTSSRRSCWPIHANHHAQWPIGNIALAGETAAVICHSGLFDQSDAACHARGQLGIERFAATSPRRFDEAVARVREHMQN